MTGTEVVVVGGGIAGTAIAWELARRGTRVTLVEQANLGAGASGRNTGTLLHQTEPEVAEMLRASEASYRELEGGDVDFAWTPRDEVLVARDGEQLRTIAARPVRLADLAAGRVDEPVGECFLLCPLPGGDALIGASLATSLRDAVEGIGAPQRIAARALELAPGLAGTVAVTRAWWGLRPMTPDGLPLAGPTGAEGLFVHGGHASLGMQAAPATAAWLAAHMHGQPVPATFAALRPDRFERSTA